MEKDCRRSIRAAGGYVVSALLIIGMTAAATGPAAPIEAIGGTISTLFGLFS